MANEKVSVEDVTRFIAVEIGHKYGALETNELAFEAYIRMAEAEMLLQLLNNRHEYEFVRTARSMLRQSAKTIAIEALALHKSMVKIVKPLTKKQTMR